MSWQAPHQLGKVRIPKLKKVTTALHCEDSMMISAKFIAKFEEFGTAPHILTDPFG